MSDPSVALDEVKPAPTVIVDEPVEYLKITTPLPPAAPTLEPLLFAVEPPPPPPVLTVPAEPLPLTPL